MMKKVLVLPVLTAALFAGACSEDGDPAQLTPTANVRFFNAATGMQASGGFTTNGQFAAGSALAYGQSTCLKVNAGSTTFGFGAAGTSGLTGSPLATSSNQVLAQGSNYVVAAVGSATSPQMFLFENSFSGTLAANQAAVRFVNFAPGNGTAATNFSVIKGVFGDPFTHGNIALGEPTSFNIVTSGSNAYTIFRGHETVVSGSDGTLNFQAGTVNTIAIVPNASGGFQLINIPRC
jgi:hypothetical protein